MKDGFVISASFIAILSAVVYSLSTPVPTTHFTEFYLHPNSTIIAYGINNYEGRQISYEVTGYFVEDKSRKIFIEEAVNLADKKTFTSSRDISQITNQSSGDALIVLELYRKDLLQKRPYRSLHFGISKSEVN